MKRKKYTQLKTVNEVGLDKADVILHNQEFAYVVGYTLHAAPHNERYVKSNADAVAIYTMGLGSTTPNPKPRWIGAEYVLQVYTVQETALYSRQKSNA